jgi:hypothetical protein
LLVLSSICKFVPSENQTVALCVCVCVCVCVCLLRAQDEVDVRMCAYVQGIYTYLSRTRRGAHDPVLITHTHIHTYTLDMRIQMMDQIRQWFLFTRIHHTYTHTYTVDMREQHTYTHTHIHTQWTCASK